MQVILDVFSGQPNPSWELSPEEERELAERLAQLPPTDQAPVADKLGYRGFLITNPEQKGGLPLEIRVGGGYVTVRGTAGSSQALDRHNLELWLMEQARKRGYGDLIDASR